MKTELILYKQRLENNGDFNIIPDYGWTFTGTDGVDWEKSEGKITKIPGSGRILYQDNILVVGREYRVRFNVSGRTTGSAAFKCKSGGATVVSIGVNGLFDYTFTADGTSLYFDITSTFDGTFSKFSITEYPDIYNIDLYDDVSIPLTFNIDDVFDLGKRKTTYSKTVKIPGTKNNNIAFDHVFEIGSEALYIPTKLSNCAILNSGIQVFSGSLSIDNIIKKIKDDTEEVEYEITVFGNLTDIFDKLGNKTIKDLDFSRWDHTFNIFEILLSSGCQSASNGLPRIYDQSVQNFIDNQTRDYTKGAISMSSVSFGGYNRVKINFGSSHLFQVGDEVVIAAEGNNLLSGDQTVVAIGANDITIAMLWDNLTSTTFTNCDVDKRTWLSQGYYYPMVDNGAWMRECVNGDVAGSNSNASGQLTQGKLYTVKLYNNSDDFSNLAKNPFTGASITVDTGVTFLVDDGITAEGGAATPNFWGGGSILLTNDFDSFGAKNYNKFLSANHWYPTDFIPHIFVKEVWDKTMQLINYYYSSTELSSNLFKRMVMPMDQSFNIHEYIGNYSPGPLPTDEETVYMNDWLPQMPLKDFVISILNLFNLVIIQDVESPNQINLICRSNFFNGDTFNLTPDISVPIEMKLSNSFLPMGYQIKYKDGEDFFNVDYNEEFGNITNTSGIVNLVDRRYGDYYVSTGNIKNTDIKKTELSFIPTVAVGNLTNLYDTYNPGSGQDKVFSATFSADKFGDNAKRTIANRILIVGLRGTDYAWSISSNQHSPIYTTWDVYDVTDTYGWDQRWYPYAMHIDNIFDPIPNYDLNFGTLLGQYFPQQFTVDEWQYQTMGQIYWGKYLLDITNVNGKVITGTFRFSITDIYNLDFRDVYVFKNYTMKLNKIMDWDVNGDGFAKCEFTLKNL